MIHLVHAYANLFHSGKIDQPRMLPRLFLCVDSLLQECRVLGHLLVNDRNCSLECVHDIHRLGLGFAEPLCLSFLTELTAVKSDSGRCFASYFSLFTSALSQPFVSLCLPLLFVMLFSACCWLCSFGSFHFSLFAALVASLSSFYHWLFGCGSVSVLCLNSLRVPLCGSLRIRGTHGHLQHHCGILWAVPHNEDFHRGHSSRRDRYGADTWNVEESRNNFTQLQDLQFSSTLEQTFHEKLPEVTGHMSSCAESNEEKEKENHARLPAQMPASRMSRNPAGNSVRPKRREHRADNAWARQQDRKIRRAATL